MQNLLDKSSKVNSNTKIYENLTNSFSLTIRHTQTDRRMEGTWSPHWVFFVTSLNTPNRARDAVYHKGTNRSRGSSVSRIATGWTVQGSNPGGEEIFRTRPTRPWGLQWVPGLLRCKALGAWRWPCTSSAVTNGRVELYLYSLLGLRGLF
jgi:hypothetical protein